MRYCHKTYSGKHLNAFRCIDGGSWGCMSTIRPMHWKMYSRSTDRCSRYCSAACIYEYLLVSMSMTPTMH